MKQELHAWQTRAVLVERSVTSTKQDRLPHRLYVYLAPLDEQGKPAIPPRIYQVVDTVIFPGYGPLPAHAYVLRDKADDIAYADTKRALTAILAEYNAGAKSWPDVLAEVWMQKHGGPATPAPGYSVIVNEEA